MSPSPHVAVRPYRLNPCTVYTYYLVRDTAAATTAVATSLVPSYHTSPLLPHFWCFSPQQPQQLCFHFSPITRVHAGGVRATPAAVLPLSDRRSMAPQPTGGPRTAPPAGTTGCASRSSDRPWASGAPSGPSRSRKTSRRLRRDRRRVPTDSSTARTLTSRSREGLRTATGEGYWVMTILRRTSSMATATALGNILRCFIPMWWTFHTKLVPGNICLPCPPAVSGIPVALRAGCNVFLSRLLLW